MDFLPLLIIVAALVSAAVVAVAAFVQIIRSVRDISHNTRDLDRAPRIARLNPFNVIFLGRHLTESGLAARQRLIKAVLLFAASVLFGFLFNALLLKLST